MAKQLVYTVQLEQFGADLLLAFANLLTVVEDADQVLIPDAVAEAAAEARTALEQWRTANP